MTDECVFCKIISGELPAKHIYDDDRIIAFHDIKPAAPVHVLVVPRKHIRSVNDLEENDREIVSDLIFTSREVAKLTSIDKSGYKIVFNTERGAGQVIFHLHIHVIGGWEDGWRK